MALVKVFDGTLSDLALQIQQVNAANFVTGDRGQLVLDFTQLLPQWGGSVVPQWALDEINAALQGVSGFISAAINAATVVIDFVSTSPTAILLVGALVALAFIVGFLVHALLFRDTGSPLGNNPLFCAVGALVGANCQTGGLITLGGAALLALSLQRR